MEARAAHVGHVGKQGIKPETAGMVREENQTSRAIKAQERKFLLTLQ